MSREKYVNLTFATDKKEVKEKCTNTECNSETLVHYNINNSHWRECPRKKCNFLELLEFQNPNCSCAKLKSAVDKKSGITKTLVNCSGRI